MSAIPEIILYTDVEQAKDGFFQHVQTKFPQAVCVNAVKAFLNLFMQGKTRVVLLHCTSMSDALITYGELLNQAPKKLITNQKAILLVDKADENDAFELYTAGLVDNYLVVTPKINIQRLFSIILHIFNELGHTFDEKPILNEGNFDEQLQSCINTGMRKKKEVMATFENMVNKLDKDVVTAINNIKQGNTANISQTLDIQKLIRVFSHFKSADLRPRLLTLELKLLRLLSLALEALNDKDYAAPQPEIDNPPTSAKTTTAQPTPASQVTNQQAAENNKPQATETAQQQKQGLANEQGQRGSTELNQFGDNVIEIPPDPEDKRRAAIASQTLYKNKKVLLVDDDPTNHQLIRNIAKASAQQVTVITNGRSAMGRIEKEHFDLVIINVELPDSDGVSLVSSINRTCGQDHELNFIMLAKPRNKDAIMRCAKVEGIKGIMTTPLTKDGVINTYKKVFVAPPTDDLAQGQPEAS
ncbi:hypothetical protein C2869_12150 [Saccharobesus litoralis]|uniref:Response regulatory domain-containing protein n=1 Tax=Saccharobesus litoralis TaxID=2172099 RepID=A0A2S0VSF7_9ALTE|nr:response regulator [Saccharobesus litoralis]AWB67139.1 hypothetical protein C2869_12150 [Saccharobesus litoralis]